MKYITLETLPAPVCLWCTHCTSMCATLISVLVKFCVIAQNSWRFLVLFSISVDNLKSSSTAAMRRESRTASPRLTVFPRRNIFWTVFTWRYSAGSSAWWRSLATVLCCALVVTCGAAVPTSVNSIRCAFPPWPVSYHYHDVPARGMQWWVRVMTFLEHAVVETASITHYSVSALLVMTHCHIKYFFYSCRPDHGHLYVHRLHYGQSLPEYLLYSVTQMDPQSGLPTVWLLMYGWCTISSYDKGLLMPSIEAGSYVYFLSIYKNCIYK